MGAGIPSGVMGKIGLFTRHFLRGPLGSLINTVPLTQRASRSGSLAFGQVRSTPLLSSQCILMHQENEGGGGGLTPHLTGALT